MITYRAYTLVDISDTKCRDPRGTTVDYRKAQNLNSLVQTLGLRAQIMDYRILYTMQDLDNFEFGTEYNGKHLIWIFEFQVETTAAWDKQAGDMYYATADIHGVPIHDALKETVVTSNTFDAYSQDKRNIYFKLA